MPGPSVTALLEVWNALEGIVEFEPVLDEKDITIPLDAFWIGRKYLHPSPTEAFDTNVISNLLRDIRRLKVMNRILNALTASSSELLDLCTRTLEPISLKLSKGLASLHDDLLVLIFKFIVRSDDDSTTHALRLSQVCQKFRRLTLRDRTLWTTLCLRTGTAEESTKLETLIFRSGSNTDLRINIKYNRSITSAVLRDTMSICWSTASRWQTLFLDGNWSDSDSGVTITDEVHQLMKDHCLTLDRLEEIRFRSNHVRWDTEEGSRHWLSSTASFANMNTWKAPNLRILRCTQYIPPPSFPFASFTTFALLLQLIPSAVRRQVDDLVAFLNSQPRVSEFSLDLDSVVVDNEEFGTEDELNPAAIVCPAVTSFQITIPGIHRNIQIEDVRNISAPIANAIRMPKLESFALSIQASDFGNDFTDAGTLPILFIPDPEHHPLLTSFNFTALVFVPEKPRSTFAELVEFDIPLDKLPRVSTMCVTTFGQFTFSGGVYEEGGDNSPLELNALRELQICSCKHIDEEALGQVVKSLRDVGAWDTLERVVIRDCGLLDYRIALEVVGKERLFFSES